MTSEGAVNKAHSHLAATHSLGFDVLQQPELVSRCTSCDWFVSCREGGTSIDGFLVKKFTGLSETFRISTGLNHVSGHGISTETILTLQGSPQSWEHDSCRT